MTTELEKSLLKRGWIGYLRTDIKVVRDRFKISIPKVGTQVNIFDLQTSAILLLNNIHPDIIIHVIEEVKNPNQCFKTLKQRFGKAKTPFNSQELAIIEKQEKKSGIDSDWLEKHRYAVS